LTHTILVLVTVGLGHGVYRKLYTLIGGQRAEKFENHWSTIRQGAAKEILFNGGAKQNSLRRPGVEEQTDQFSRKLAKKERFPG